MTASATALPAGGGSAAPRHPRWVEVGGERLDGSRAGVTLVEVIVALALGALVVAFLAEGTGLIRHFARIGRIVSAQDETLAVRDHLRRTVESATNSGGAIRQDAFAGVGDTAVFTVPGDRLLEAGGPVRITLAVLPDGPAMSLVETRTPAGAPEAQRRTRRLLTGATHIAFSYFGVMGSASPTWLTEWTDPGASPALMRIDVAFRPEDLRKWPDFVVNMPTGGAPVAIAPAAVPKGGKPPRPG